MRRFLTVLCALGCYTATTHSSPSTPPTFGDWSAPTPVTSLNTASNDEYAVLSKDELTIYFTSDREVSCSWKWRPRSMVCHARLCRFAMGPPDNMGPTINSAADDSLPFLSSNEHVLYFYSSRQAGDCGPGGTGESG